MLSTLQLLVALCASSAAAVKIRSVSHSGSACPQDTNVSYRGDINDLTLSLSGFGETVGTSQTTNCEVHIVIDGGVPGQALVLKEVEVEGTLSMSADSQASFYTSAFWSETASNQDTKTITTKSAAASSSKGVSLNNRFALASQCVDKDGYVGILNVNFRMASDSGKISFGPNKSVTEHLQLEWKAC